MTLSANQNRGGIRAYGCSLKTYLSHKLESSGWVVYFETVAEILAEILLMFSTVVQTIGIYNTRICIH